MRPITLHDFQVLEIEDLESTSVIGYPITGLTNGFRGIGLSMRLMELAIGELLLGISKIKNFDSTILSEASLFICFSKCREENFEFYDEILKQTLIRSVTDILMFHSMKVTTNSFLSAMPAYSLLLKKLWN